MTTKTTGKNAENIAITHIQKYGYEIINTNYYSPYGEIDIICLHQNCIIFIEVRYRKNTNFGSAAATVLKSKQRRIIKTATCFLTEFPKYQDLEARFDIIGIEGSDKQNIEWLKAAFML